MSRRLAKPGPNAQLGTPRGHFGSRSSLLLGATSDSAENTRAPAGTICASCCIDKITQNALVFQVRSSSCWCGRNVDRCGNRGDRRCDRRQRWRWRRACSDDRAGGRVAAARAEPGGCSPRANRHRGGLSNLDSAGRRQPARPDLRGCCVPRSAGDARQPGFLPAHTPSSILGHAGPDLRQQPGRWSCHRGTRAGRGLERDPRLARRSGASDPRSPTTAIW